MKRNQCRAATNSDKLSVRILVYRVTVDMRQHCTDGSFRFCRWRAHIEAFSEDSGPEALSTQGQYFALQGFYEILQPIADALSANCYRTITMTRYSKVAKTDQCWWQAGAADAGPGARGRQLTLAAPPGRAGLVARARRRHRSQQPQGDTGQGRGRLALGFRGPLHTNLLRVGGRGPFVLMCNTQEHVSFSDPKSFSTLAGLLDTTVS